MTSLSLLCSRQRPLRIALLALLGLPVLPGVAAAELTSPGNIVVTATRMNPGAADFRSTLKTAALTSLPKDPDNDQWHVEFIAYLSRAPGADDVNLVFYDMPSPGGKSAPAPKPAGGLREPVNAYPIKTKSTAKVLMAAVDIKPEDGFKPGRKYQVYVARLVNGKEEVYARTQLDLKDAATGATGGPAKPGAVSRPGAIEEGPAADGPKADGPKAGSPKADEPKAGPAKADVIK